MERFPPSEAPPHAELPREEERSNPTADYEPTPPLAPILDPLPPSPTPLPPPPMVTPLPVEPPPELVKEGKTMEEAHPCCAPDARTVTADSDTGRWYPNLAMEDDVVAE